MPAVLGPEPLDTEELEAVTTTVCPIQRSDGEDIKTRMDLPGAVADGPEVDVADSDVEEEAGAAV